MTDIARSETKPNNAIVETNKPGWDSNVGSTLRRDTVCSFKIFFKYCLTVALNFDTRVPKVSKPNVCKGNPWTNFILDG